MSIFARPAMTLAWASAVGDMQGCQSLPAPRHIVQGNGCLNRSATETLCYC
jgi:hypothetical protein